MSAHAYSARLQRPLPCQLPASTACFLAGWGPQSSRLLQAWLAPRHLHLLDLGAVVPRQAARSQQQRFRVLHCFKHYIAFSAGLSPSPALFV
jgi:hypothetical protein